MRDELAIVVGAQFFIYAVGWSGIALLDRRQRVTCALWVLYNCCQALSIVLLARAATVNSPGLGFASLLLAISGYALPNLGADRFLHGRVLYGRIWGGLALVGILLAVNPGRLLSPALAVVLSLNGSAIAFSFFSVLFFRQPLTKEFGWAGLSALVPTVIFGLMLVVKTVIALVDENVAEAMRSQSRSRLGLFVLILSVSGAVNMTFVGLYVSRLLRGIKSKATVDSLTGLANRRETQRLLQAEWRRHQRSGQPLSVAFVDVDHFKRINDRGGHRAGDQILRVIGGLLCRELRSSDRVGRWGGEEFLIILPETSADAAVSVLARVHQALERERPAVPAGCQPLTISVGISCNRPPLAQITCSDSLVACADQAMYRAKEAGRNRTLIFPSDCRGHAG